MSTRAANESSSSTSSAKKRRSKIHATQSPRGKSLTISEPEVVQLPTSRSKMKALLKTPAFQLLLDNDVSYRVAVNVLKLRRHRAISQAVLAKLADTSQPKIARVESGDDNITLKTLRKLVVALDGRVLLSIQPRELHMPRLPDWWEAPLFVSETIWQPNAACVRELSPDNTALVAAWTTTQTVKVDGHPAECVPLELAEVVA